jgi:hypothetical protein
LPVPVDPLEDPEDPLDEPLVDPLELVPELLEVVVGPLLDPPLLLVLPAGHVVPPASQSVPEVAVWQ